MRWVDNTGAEQGELYYLIVKYRDSDKKQKKFYYLASGTGVHQMTVDLWLYIVHSLEAENIYLSWERKDGSKYLDDAGFTYLE